MVAYFFKKRFAEPILAGTKLHTVRAPSERFPLPGEALLLYTGMRTEHCVLIARKTCKTVLRVRICAARGWVTVDNDGSGFFFIDKDKFARRDGFADWEEMRAFWREERPKMLDGSVFEGGLIGWWAT